VHERRDRLYETSITNRTISKKPADRKPTARKHSPSAAAGAEGVVNLRPVWSVCTGLAETVTHLRRKPAPQARRHAPAQSMRGPALTDIESERGRNSAVALAIGCIDPLAEGGLPSWSSTVQDR
jgi:hypothetical protein